jgi:hypothetical protein
MSSIVEEVIDERSETAMMPLRCDWRLYIYASIFCNYSVARLVGYKIYMGDGAFWNVWICIDTVYGKQLAVFVQQ